MPVETIGRTDQDRQYGRRSEGHRKQDSSQESHVDSFRHLCLRAMSVMAMLRQLSWLIPKAPKTLGVEGALLQVSLLSQAVL